MKIGTRDLLDDEAERGRVNVSVMITVELVNGPEVEDERAAPPVPVVTGTESEHDVDVEIDPPRLVEIAVPMIPDADVLLVVPSGPDIEALVPAEDGEAPDTGAVKELDVPRDVPTGPVKDVELAIG